MLQTKVNLFLDIHSDETIPQNFLAGCEGISSFEERHKSMQESIKASVLTASPDFQVEQGYSEDKPKQANLSMTSTWVGE